MPGGISDREALNLNDLLSQQTVAVDKLSVYANECSDPELKRVCRELIDVNMRHFERLMQQIGVSASQGHTIGTQSGLSYQMPASGYGTQSTQSYSPHYGSTSQSGGATWGSGQSNLYTNIKNQ